MMVRDASTILKVLPVFLICAVGAAACSDDCAETTASGTHGGACLPGSTCASGLVCISGICVTAPEAGICSTGLCPDAGTCPACKDAGPCPQCKDTGPCPQCKDAGPCADAAVCPQCKDAGSCADAAVCPQCKDAGTCADAAPCATCPDAGPCPACPDQGLAKPDAGGALSITWGSMTDMQDKHAEGAALVLAGKLYVLGPFGAASIKRELFDFATNKWSTFAPLPTGFRNDMGMRAAVVLNGKIHVVNGHIWYTPYTDHYAYDPTTQSWTKKASFPKVLGKSCAAEHAGKFYVVGGQNPINSSTTAGDLWVYDPVTDKWTAAASMPTKRADLACAFVGGTLLATGGYTKSNQPVANLEAYDSNTNTWSKRKDMPAAIYEAGNAAHEVNGRLVVIGGVTGAGKHTNQVQVYDPGSDSWSMGAPIKHARGAHAVAYHGNKVYVIGGYGGGWRKDVEVGTVK